MAYISTPEVKEIRENLKKLFPSKKGWKLSITREHYSKVNVVIVQAPIELRENPEREHENVNYYYIKERKNTIAADLLQMIYEICNVKNNDRSNVQEDYFDVGYYFGLSIGDWDKPFKLIQ